MRALVLIALFLPSLAFGRGGGNTAQNNWSRVTMHIPATEIGTTLVTTSGLAVTNARATAGNYASGAATIAASSSSTPRVEANGTLQLGERSNWVIRSQQFDNAAWTATTLTVTADSTVAPDGTTTADTLADTVLGGLVQSTGITATAKTYTFSVYVKVSASTQAFDIVLYDLTGVATYCSATNQTATTTWQRFSCTGSGAATNGNSLVARIYPGQAAGSGTVIAWGAQVEKNENTSTTGVTTYVATTTVAVNEQRDSVSVNSHLGAGDRDFCIAALITPYRATDNWDNADFPAIFHFGGNGVADSFRLYGFPNNTDLHMDIYDSAAASKTVEVSKPSVGSAVTIHACSSNAVWTIYKDKVAGTQTRAGAGTGYIALDTANHKLLQVLGAWGAGGSGLQGYARNIKVCRTADPSRC